MQYKAVDYWNSSYIEHHGVKGMKWGIRKAVERTGRIVRRVGGTVGRTAGRVAGGAYRVGSAVRRFKNRRAIKSGNAQRILNRASRMNNQELQEAYTRAQLVNNISNSVQNGTRTKTLGTKIAEGLEQKTVDMAKNYMQTSVESILTGETPLTGIKRDAKVSIAKKEKTLNVMSNNSSTDKSSSSSDQSSDNKNDAIKFSKVYSIPEPIRQTPIADINLASRQQVRSGVYVYRHLRHDDFLAHYGVKGMKWGVRKQYERTLNGLEKQRLKMIDKKLKSIRVSNSRFSSSDKKRQALNDAKNYDKQSKRITRQQDSILKEIKKNGGGTDVIGYEKSAPSYNRNYVLGSLLAGPIANIPLAAYYGNPNVYASKSLNYGGDTPQNIYSQKFKVRNTQGSKYGHRTTGARYYNSSTPINLLREHAHNVTRRYMYKEKR